MTQRVIGLGAALGDGTGDGLRVGGQKINDNFSELYQRTQGIIAVPGGTADDTAAVLAGVGAAVAANAVLVLQSAEYNIDPAALGVISGSVAIRIGANTRVNSLQTSGVKLPILRFAGQGLIGSAIAVSTVDNSSAVSNTITVADASSFAVADVVRLAEDQPDATETKYNGAATAQDFNYREYLTIESISGNDITFQEFLRSPFDAAKSLKLQKVSFLSDVHVTGGIFTGDNAAGGAVRFEFCRDSSIAHCSCDGVSDAQKNGGSGFYLDQCWEATVDGVSTHNALFVASCNKNQSCTWTNIRGKRTANGGLTLSGSRFCLYNGITLDSPGDDNGDCFPTSNGWRNNTLTNAVVHGSNCYSMWMHQSCDGNLVLFHSYAGITACVISCGSDNYFTIKARGHGGDAISDLGTNNRYDLDVISPGGDGIQLGPFSDGCVVRGHVEHSGTNAYDVQISSASNADIDTFGGGSRGVNLSGTLSSSNKIRHRGEKPYNNYAQPRARGYSWANTIAISGSFTPAQIPGDNGDGSLIDWVSQNSADSAEAYRVTLALSSVLADTISEYIVIDRQNGLTIKKVYEGSGTYVNFVPKLIAVSGVIGVNNENGGAGTVVVLLEKF